jgi:glycogen operon protein
MVLHERAGGHDAGAPWQARGVTTPPNAVDVAVPAPGAQAVSAHLRRDGTVRTFAASRRADGWWTASLADAVDGDVWWWEVDGVAPLLDPSTPQMRIVDGLPHNVVRTTWPSRPSLGWHHPDPVIYELHVRGFGRTFDGVRSRLPYLAGLGVDVVELLPVHPFDPSDNYWGYMPLVWGAVHEPYGRADAAEELAVLCDEAHALELEVWLDVVFNHTGEGNWSLPTRSLRGLPGVGWYRMRDDGSPFDDSGCGNDIDPAEPHVRRLVLEALDRYADLGVDGFRFDLASLLTRDGGGLVDEITAWAGRRGVVLVAEAWDLGSYQVGAEVWPDAWRQWNDRFRDDVRGFVRAEEGKVPAIVQRVQGSPDVLGADGASRTVNFVSAHDGLTLFDLTVVTSDRHHSWDCGDQLRPRMLRNLLVLLLLADGAAMFVQGDEFGRTQGGHDNPFDIDGPISWVDWLRADEFADLREFIRQLLVLRRGASRRPVEWFAVDGGELDTGWSSRSLAWRTDDLWVAANMWWEPLPLTEPPAGWVRVVETAPQHPGELAARSIIVWHRTP